MGAIGLFGSSEYTNTVAKVQDELIAAAFGSAKADFTRRQLAPGEHTVTAFALFGSVRILVPPEIGIAFDNVNIFGSAGIKSRAPGEMPDGDRAPVRLRIRSLALFGSVSVVRMESAAPPAPTQLTDTPEAASLAPAFEGETQRLERS
jgi:hypothetical protein